MADNISVLISEEELDKRIRELGAQISREYEGKELHMICVLKGGVFFMVELAKRITVPVSLDFMAVSSYGSGTVSSGSIRIKKDLDASIELCTMLDKPERREVKDVHVRYTGFVVPDEFVVGYGLDYDQKYRNLPYIGVLKE